MYASVAIPRSAPEPLWYRIPPELAGAVRPGVRVRVPVRRTQATGVVIDLQETTELDPAVIRPLSEVLDTEPLLPAHIFDLAHFIASYYRCPIGTTLAAMLPSGLVRADAERAEPTPLGAAFDREVLPAPQGAILDLLLEKGKMPVAGLLARSGASRRALESLEKAGLVRLRRTRRDRPPKTEVGALALAPGPVEAHLESCARAPRQQEAIAWLAELEAPTLESILCHEVGCTPAIIRALEKKGIVRRFRQAGSRKARWSLGGSDTRHDLTGEQEVVVEAVIAAADAGEYAPILLEGITGSGKTEVYLRCLEHVLANGRQGIVLVPEIGLTPATVGAVERRFGSSVAVLHSAQAEGERWKEWLAIHSGGVDIVVGPRSALFAPVRSPGLIVVDEEHDGAYKQQDNPRYNARDLALLLGKKLSIPVLLCSATPSTEAAQLEQRGLARRFRLTTRPSGARLPDVEIVDLRHEAPEPGEHGRTLFSSSLRSAMEETLKRGRQVILLMQRRGWAPVLLCRDCGHTLECPSCSVAMVVHRRRGDLECHYCSARRDHPARCPSCGGAFLDPVGAGTEKVAHHLKNYFPEATTAILDRDTVRRRGGLQETLGAFDAGKIQVLVGTQMVAKGHHFPNVTLTGVISADSLLGLPDFRAGERTFQLLTQLAGRAGRGADSGRVVVQTYHPEHPSILHAANHDVSAFTKEELRFRHAFGYPPLHRAALIRFESQSEDDARQAADLAWKRLYPPPAGVRVRGPAPSPLERLRDRWRWQILLTCPDRPPLREALDRLEKEKSPSTVMRIVDVDPQSTL